LGPGKYRKNAILTHLFKYGLLWTEKICDRLATKSVKGYGMEHKNEGVCRFCLKKFSGAGMGRHLLTCKTRKEKNELELKGIWEKIIFTYWPATIRISSSAMTVEKMPPACA
jgi:hypothetical protein